MVLCEDQFKLSKLRNFDRGVIDGCAIKVIPWCAKFVSENQGQEFLNGWVKIRDLPILRTAEIFRKLASVCGGLVDQKESILFGSSWEEDVWIKTSGYSKMLLSVL